MKWTKNKVLITAIQLAQINAIIANWSCKIYVAPVVDGKRLSTT